MQSLLSKTIATLALAGLLAALFLAPGPAWAKKKPRVDPSKLLWPRPPEIPRISYLASYYGDDVKGVKKKTLLERLAGVEDRTSRSFLIKPYGVAVDSSGKIYVTDTISAVVYVFDPERKILEYRGDNAPANFRKPTGLAIDDQDRLFVADSEEHNVTAFNPSGEVLSIFGTKELQRPAGLAVDSVLKRLYVADVKARKVAVYDLSTLKLLRWFGKAPNDPIQPGEENQVLVSPINLALDPDGMLYVVDTFTNRVVVFDTDGEFVRQIGTIGTGAGQFMRPRAVAVDCDGHVYVTDAMAGLFQIFTTDGKPLMPVGGFGSDPGRFQVPAGIAIDGHNRVIVADQLNRRIQVFRYTTDAEASEAEAKRGNRQPAPGVAAKE